MIPDSIVLIHRCFYVYARLFCRATSDEIIALFLIVEKRITLVRITLEGGRYECLFLLLFVPLFVVMDLFWRLQKPLGQLRQVPRLDVSHETAFPSHLCILHLSVPSRKAS